MVARRAKVAQPQPPRMSVDEQRLARLWHAEDGLGPTEIGARLRRSAGSISRLLAVDPDHKNAVGRPRKLTEGQIDNVVKLVERMVVEADAEAEVTMRMVLERSRLRVSLRTVANALHARGYYFHRLREKLLLTPEDVRERYAFAAKYKSKPQAWWLRHIDLHLDNKCFKVATTYRGRRLLSMRGVRGAYRTRGRSLAAGHVKAGRKHRHNTGAKGVLIAGGVTPAKTLVWHIIDGTWNSATAAGFYRDVVAPKLAATHPRKRRFVLLEDNDPVGNQSRAGRAAKRDAGMNVFTIPKRSPEFNVMDFAVWSEVERRMRRQERSFPKSKRETRGEFILRLQRTARNLSKAFLTRSIADLRRRCELCYKAKGGLFEEGGRSPSSRRRL